MNMNYIHTREKIVKLNPTRGTGGIGFSFNAQQGLIINATVYK